MKLSHSQANPSKEAVQWPTTPPSEAAYQPPRLGVITDPSFNFRPRLNARARSHRPESPPSNAADRVSEAGEASAELHMKKV